MSMCDVEIHLEKADATFTRGEIVRGRVRVTPHGDVECRGLKLWAGWRTHGRGNTASSPDGIVRDLFHGHWRAGQPQEYPFEFPAPGGPATYHGVLLNVDHYVTASADVPWSSDPTGEIEILIPGHDGPDYDHGPEFGRNERPLLTPETAPIKPNAATKGIVAVLGLGVAAAFFYFGGWGFLAVIAFVILAGSFAFLKRGVAERRLGKPLVRVEPDPVRLGSEVRVQVAFEPASSVVLKGGTLRLIGLERVVSGSGTNKTTRRHEVCSLVRELPLAHRRVGAGQPISIQETLTIPADAGPTFAADDNELTWAVHLSIAIEGWPDWEKTFPLTVRP